MRQTFETCLTVGPETVLHLPWQGCWQLPIRHLDAPVKLEAASLPLCAIVQRGSWKIGALRFREHEHVFAITMRRKGDQLAFTFDGDWDGPPEWRVEEHRHKKKAIQAIRNQFPAIQKTSKARFRRMFILDIHDPHGNLLQTFSDVCRFVELCAKLQIARGTLFYLPGWDGEYDGTYPDYHPAKDAGGAAGFCRLINIAREAGGEILAHMNHWALSDDRASIYPQLEPFILRDRHGNKAGWPGYIWCGVTNKLHYVDPGCETWIKLFSERLAALEELGLRAVYLDQIGTPMPENWRARQKEFIRCLRKRHPNLIFGSEGVTQDVLPDFSLSQIWGPPWAAMPEQPVLRPSSFLADVLEKSLQLVGHLGTPAPYPCRYAWTNFLYLTEHGPTETFRRAWKLHQVAGALPTLRMDTRRIPANQRILRKLFSTR